jgi:hypothetical protein
MHKKLPMLIDDAQLNKFILDSNLVSKAEFDDAKKLSQEKKVRPTDVLIAAGKLTEDNVRRMQAYVLGIPFVDLKNKKIPFETLSIIPEPVARNHNVVAYKMTADTLEVAMLDTDDLSAIDFVKKKSAIKNSSTTDRHRVNKDSNHSVSKKFESRIWRYYPKRKRNTQNYF